jgi:predicted GIY-YIG superfamily endonuclease
MATTTMRTGAATQRDTACAVYVAYDRAGQPIYIGISTHPRRRWAQHAAKPWAREVATWDVLCWHTTRWDALAHEAALIHRHRPRWNQDGNPDEALVRRRLATLTPRQRRHWALRLIGLLARTIWAVLTFTTAVLWATLALLAGPPRRRTRRRTRRRRRHGTWQRTRQRT